MAAFKLIQRSAGANDLQIDRWPNLWTPSCCDSSLLFLLSAGGGCPHFILRLTVLTHIYKFSRGHMYYVWFSLRIRLYLCLFSYSLAYSLPVPYNCVYILKPREGAGGALRRWSNEREIPSLSISISSLATLYTIHIIIPSQVHLLNWRKRLHILEGGEMGGSGGNAVVEMHILQWCLGFRNSEQFIKNIN